MANQEWLEVALMRHALDVKKLVDKLASMGEGNVSCAIDLVMEIPESQEVQFGAWCLELFDEITRFLRQIGERREIIMSLPLMATDMICLKSPSTVASIERYLEPPEVYLNVECDFLIPAAEEYRKILNTSTNVAAIFRSWRDKDGAEFGWEYNNCVFLWNSNQGSAMQSASDLGTIP